jgi:choline dehydrogenase
LTDYIVVGAGSAGCVVASRLSEDTATQVTLFEAGGRDTNPFIHMPAGYFRLMQTLEADWGYKTEPHPHLHNRVSIFPRGKVLGGSSAVNGMLFSRGNRNDFDNWAQMGNQGWAYEDVLPYFKKAEGWVEGETEYHGGSGPWLTSHVNRLNPLSVAWLEAGPQAGYRRNSDFNGAAQEGFGRLDVNIGNGRRSSSASTYLASARKRSNLEIVTNALVTRILFAGKRAVGIEYLRDGNTHTLHCAKEVIISGGAVNSPQLLQLSGIGEPDHLRSLGIEIVQELPGVGRNLQDHVNTGVQYECTQPITLLKVLRPWNTFKALAQYALFKTGPAAQPGTEAMAFLKTDERLADPDLILFMIPILYADHGRTVPRQHGFMVVLYPARPESRGTVMIKSNDPRRQPAIQLNALAAHEDLDLLVRGIDIARHIIAQRAFDPYRGREIFPGPGLTSATQLEEAVRSSADTTYHPVGTCKMGSDGASVVDAQLRVRGIAGLRVVDASIMPRIVSANTNAACVMIGEKAADLIRAA